jgi:D-alanyl-lipoteichoic acid acyltransferase DltB (MBOAT superfamily)
VKGERLKARYTKWIAVRNTFIIFLLSGFWHGANWTFVLWGAYHALLFVPLLLLNKNRRYRDTVATTTLPDGTVKTKWVPSLKEASQMLLTFALAVFGWIIFRADSIGQFTSIVSSICTDTLLTIPWLMSQYYYIPLTCCIVILLITEWLNRTKEHALQLDSIKSRPLRWLIYLGMILIMFLMANVDNAQFIYFQF